MSFCRLIIFFFLRARAHISYSFHARKSSNSSRTTPCVRSYRSLVRRKSQQELVAKRENVFKIFPLEISTVSRPGCVSKKSTKRRERFEFYGVGIDARGPRSDVPIAHQNRNSFPSTSNARASVKKSKGRSKKTHRRCRSGWLFRFRRNVPFRLHNQRSSLVVGRLGDLRNHASG